MEGTNRLFRCVERTASLSTQELSFQVGQNTEHIFTDDVKPGSHSGDCSQDWCEKLRRAWPRP